ncbi:hypothetical protein IEO21_09739 [Rhodonia placenta]|uniref:Uncharacterized protein n=1 Tax=Rhodonia placenta TaxID=104341 RepID=A0A8H7TXF4_9APHY|nr:hypothetical protein IEO21_09739 [Postia placenta]
MNSLSFPPQSMQHSPNERLAAQQDTTSLLCTISLSQPGSMVW